MQAFLTLNQSLPLKNQDFLTSLVLFEKPFWSDQFATHRSKQKT
ncbi:hypothetical protein AM1_0093 [Acaryochloris marina MBIC11017]|uniref:Uncharacterized protein n=1 Tax=Acaryochloris marina (strain MBIC 11017) TaxID=329726 RepID=B0C687_ACAM1|nr:hypothetical protein AM1_0093 [Acaryochloris marina MBIC11017]